MSGLTFNPAFHSAVLSTLREGVIHLALPQPDVARLPDFPKRAFQELLGVSPKAPQIDRFRAASDLIRFAVRDLTESDRPEILSPLWQSEPWESEKALIAGVFCYLEKTMVEACLVLDETSYVLSRHVWQEPDNPAHWAVMADFLQATTSWDERRARDTKAYRKELIWAATIRKTVPKGGYSLSNLKWNMGFLTTAKVRQHHLMALKRLQLLPEARFLRNLKIALLSSSTWSRMIDIFPTLALKRARLCDIKI